MNRYVKFIIPGVLLLVLGIWLFFSPHHQFIQMRN